MDITGYVANIPAQRIERFKAITALINLHFPKADLSMKYKMPTFEYENNWVAVANQKNYLSLYTCAAEHLGSFQKKYPKIKTGKGCINIKDNDDFIIEDLLPVIVSALTTQK